MKAIAVWTRISVGVFLLGLAAIFQLGGRWWWMFVLIAGMSAVKAAVTGRWRWFPHPFLWAAGLSYAFASPEVGGGTMFVALAGASLLLGFFISLVPRRERRPPPSPPPPPGAGVVLDAEVMDRGE